MKKGCGEMKV